MDSQELRNELIKNNIEFEAVFHKAVYTSLEGHMLSLPHSEAEAKNLFLKSKKSFVLMTVKGDKRVDLKAMAKELGYSSFSFAKEDDLLTLLSLTPGSVTLIYVHPMENTSSLLLSSNDLYHFLSSQGIKCNWIDIKTKEA